MFTASIISSVYLFKREEGDDTAANYVKFRCRHKSGGNEVELREFPGQQLPSSAFLGDYVGWSTSCKEGSAICGMKQGFKDHEEAVTIQL